MYALLVPVIVGIVTLVAARFDLLKSIQTDIEMQKEAKELRLTEAEESIKQKRINRVKLYARNSRRTSGEQLYFWSFMASLAVAGISTLYVVYDQMSKSEVKPSWVILTTAICYMTVFGILYFRHSPADDKPKKSEGKGKPE